MVLLGLWGRDTVWLKEGSEEKDALSFSFRGPREEAISLRTSGLSPVSRKDV